MSIVDLAHLSGVPFLGTGVTILKTTLTGIQNVKLYKQQCQDMGGRCVNLMTSLRDSSQGLEGNKVLEIADEIETIIIRVDRKVKEWGSWNQLKSFLAQSEIKDGIDRLHRDIDAAMMKFNMQMGMEMTRNQLESKATQERDKAEIREVLHVIVKSQDDMRALLSMQPSRDSRPVEEMMESLQTELRDPSLLPVEEEVFKAGLWELHEKTEKLPPLTDLSGQVTLSSHTTVVKGAFNDIYIGQWLDKETVALRLPRTLANNADVQDRFQREVAMWREFKHPNVVPLYGIIYVEEDILSVSPWMDNGTADVYVKKHPTVDRLKILADAASGLEYLHNRGIVHGDLRAANVLISKDGTARLSDFGLSKFMEDCGKRMTTSYSVNPRWFAPELLTESGPVSTHSDVWSFGMTCLEILSGDVPFADIRRDIAVLREIDHGVLPKHPGRVATSQGLSDTIWQVLQKCWEREPPMRPSVTEVKNSLLGIGGGVTTPETKPSTRKWPTFSLGRGSNRPSTSSSDIFPVSPSPVPPQTSRELRRPATSPGNSNQIPEAAEPSASSSNISPVSISPQTHRGWRRSSGNSNQIPETDELSPLSVPSIHHGFMGNSPHSTHRNNSVASLNSSLNPGHYNPSYSNPAYSNPAYFNPAYSIDFDRPPISPQQLHPPRSASLSGAPTLPLPLSSTSPPRLGSSRFPADRSVSHDSFSVPARSFLSSDSSAHLGGPVREAVTDTRIVVIVNETGVVQSGTLEGLVERLIINFNLRQDIEYRDVLLTACADFTTPEDFFGMLSRRFYEAESKPGQHPGDRVAVQYNIFMVIMYWLSNQHLQVDPQLLWQMRNFCESAIRMKSSSTMVDKARDLLCLIDVRGSINASSLSLLLSPGRRSVQAPQIKPNELAIALTLLEGDKYKVLVPSDYIAHLRRHSGHNNVEGAYTTNNKIIFWVKDSVLHYDTVEKRADVLKFFIHTAQECRKLRNFSSLVAIAIALHSAPIERLKLTKSSLTLQMQGKLQALHDIIDPTANHRGYREALNDVPSAEQRDRCIPWLAVHLKELHVVLHRYPITVQVDGRPLINFQRYLKFMDRVKEVLYYKHPDLEPYRQLGQLDYLENQLKNLRMSPTSDDDQMARSRILEARETLDFKTRKPQLRALGFKTR